MEYINQALELLNWLALNMPWDAVLASGALSAVLVGPQKLVKKWFKHNEQVMIALVGIGGLLVAAANYLLTTPTDHPQIVALQGFAIAFGSQPFYYLMVKPLVRRLSTWWALEIAAANTINEAKTALVPAGGLPVVQDVLTPPAAPIKGLEIQDFDH